jgi:hypothetical protein
MGFINFDWKQYVVIALVIAVISFLTVGEVIEWIFYFWFDELSVRTMKIHGFYWGGGVAVIMFVGYLLTIYESQKSKAVD